MVGPEERHRGEGVPVLVIAQAEPPVAILPTGEYRAVLCQDHRVVSPATTCLATLPSGRAGTAVKVFLFVLSPSPSCP